MLDTNVFNAVLNGELLKTSCMGRRLLVTGIQADELRATKEITRRANLLAIFEEINPTLLPASSFALDIEGAGLDQAYWNDGSGNFERMLARLKQLDSKNKKNPNQLRDILIAETAIQNVAILVSGDANLRRVVSEFGGQAIRWRPANNPRV
jgi:predicted nucleic acid-binding protein